MSKFRLLVLGFFLFFAQHAIAQTKQVTGRVTDASGAPLSNVSVTAKNSRTGTATAADGTFTLTVNENVKVLVFSAIGFESVEMTITGGPIAVSLKAGDSQSMDEVIVVGYGTKIKKDLTGNIADQLIIHNSVFAACRPADVYAVPAATIDIIVLDEVSIGVG